MISKLPTNTLSNSWRLVFASKGQRCLIPESILGNKQFIYVLGLCIQDLMG